jgi:hypothetical protein
MRRIKANLPDGVRHKTDIRIGKKVMLMNIKYYPSKKTSKYVKPAK